ncbi:DUF5779 family protein [Haloferacaceae archaeon DSL9]
MSDFDLDLRAAEEELEEVPDEEVILGVLDGSRPADEWITAVKNGNVLVLAVDGDLSSLAAGFAREIKDLGGELMHFRGFLVVSPPETGINTDRL